MATRKQVAESQARKAERLEALRALEGETLPLPTEKRSEPIPYSDDLPAECVELGRQGLSEAQIAAHWAIDIETMREWGDQYPALKAALSRARTAMRAWWEEKARSAIVKGDNRFPAGAWSQVMRARFSEYDDKQLAPVVIDLRQLVQIRLPDPAGLPVEQRAARPIPLEGHATVRLAPGLTASDGSKPALSRARRPVRSRAAGGQSSDPEGGGGKTGAPAGPTGVTPPIL